MTADKKTPVLIGLSFGTLNSTLAIVGKDGRGETIANEDGDRSIPSYYAFTGHGEELAGSQAKVQAMSNPSGTITQFRNLLGKKFDDEVTKHQIDALFMNIIASSKDATLPAYETESWPEDAEEAKKEEHTPQEVAAKYLRKVRETAENFLGHSVDGCVISTPVYFADAEREALLKAVQEAGFGSAYTVHEPVAAALAYDKVAELNAASNGEKLTVKKDKLVVVLDLGGHQFNATVLSSNNGLYTIIASEDDEHLGGEEFDEILMKFVASDFKRKTKMDIGNNRRARAKLQKACEQTKRALTRQDNAPCSVESLFEGQDYHGTVNRMRFESLADSLISRCMSLMRQVLTEAEVKVEDIDEVLLVGGASNMPLFHRATKNVFPSTTIRTDVEPQEATAVGCAVQAGIIVSTPANLDYAAASQNTDVVNAQHLSHPIGLVLGDGKFLPVLPKRAPIPSRRTVSFGVAEGQKEVYLQVSEQKSEKESILLAELVLSDLPADLKTSGATIDVVFTIEKDGVLTVSAKEKTSGNVVKAKISRK
ncbi:heat shock protein 70 family [Fimicolochytrium jonesii]|uniref:heat shock protein 70 family n=1 Tax=Fimicolochytrium jonesii TaxID=1396493 RepID=UPI0022FF328B|nr:heat shock protein 70 family [Fimicolochytrium jonesii]KAI8816729.1 heat shock protein 70 family [Fimicolochytrium jonesii]